MSAHGFEKKALSCNERPNISSGTFLIFWFASVGFWFALELIWRQGLICLHDRHFIAAIFQKINNLFFLKKGVNRCK
jgi:hypothetical protein